MIFRFILFSFLFFIIIKAVRFIYNNLLKASSEGVKPKVHSKSKNSEINKEDIIDANFEEIKSSDNKDSSN